GLVAHPAAMATNLGARGGYVLSERVMQALSEQVGKQTAHLLVYDASMAGVEQGLSLREALAASPEVGRHLSPTELDALCDPAAAVDQAPEVVDEILAALEKSRALDPPGWP
ncbi:MAG TPA: adenylosuccinate lyase, partial [Actinomycetes bacterium]|nr:adenylosuccinate lyase [Actinomycetes bacterium]